MRKFLKMIWLELALFAGVLLMYFEFSRKGGITGEGWFWVFIAAVIILMALVGIYQKWTTPRDADHP